MKIIKDYFITIIILIILAMALLVCTYYSKNQLKNGDTNSNINSSTIDDTVYQNSHNNTDSYMIDSKPTKLNTGISVDQNLLNSNLTNEDKLSILNNPKYNLEDRISSYLGYDKENVGFIYYDLTSNKYIKFNENDIFIAASTYKVSLNVLTYEKAKENKNLINTTINYSDKYYEEGTGILQDLSTIPPMKIQKLLDLSIINSDNIATNMVGTYLGGHDEVRKQIWNMFNINIPYSDNVTTPNAELKILKHIYDNKNEENYAHLIKVLQSTDCHTRIDKYIPQDIVAHKIGSSNEYIHDISIVLSDNPYIFIIYTKGLDDSEEKIAQISKAVYNYQTTQRSNH